MSSKKNFFNYIVIVSFLFVSCATTSAVDFEKKLISKGYVETFDSGYFPSQVIKRILDADYKIPYTFELKNTESKNYTVIYIYFFEECSNKMINKYVKLLLIDKYGFYKFYENENINNQKGCPYEFDGVVYDNDGKRIERPIFYLWD